MTYDSLVNRDYFSAHYLAEVLPRDLKKGLWGRWTEDEKDGRDTPRKGILGLRRTFTKDRAFFTEIAEALREGKTLRPADALEYGKTLHELNGTILRALGFDARPQEVTVTRAGTEHTVQVAHAETGIIAIECGWATDVDAATDPDQAGRLLSEVQVGSQPPITAATKLVSHLFATESAPQYVLVLAGGVLILGDRLTWSEGRYLGVSLDVALGRNDARPEGELALIAALFGADSLRPPPEGGDQPLADLVTKSGQHAVGVSTDLRDGLRESVEIIANEVLLRIHEAGYRPDQIGRPRELARQLTRESLRYLYRVLFLLYAESRPELGILPVDHPEYADGYGLQRLGELVITDLGGEEAQHGFHFYESLDLLFRMVNKGHRPHGTETTTEGDDKRSDDVGIRFEALRSDLFEPKAIQLISGSYELSDDEDELVTIDTRLRNAALHRVLRKLMLSKGRRKERGGFISYAQLGISQLGAVYEGLMSYTGFIAEEELYEVAKNGDRSGGSWMIPASKLPEYEAMPDVFVLAEDEETGVKKRVRYPAGSFVYRLAGRDRQTSASYYTPDSLTKVTVELALKHRIDQDGTKTEAREILDWTICEPALGSGAFLNEAIDQVAAAYLKRRQEELEPDQRIEPEDYPYELQKAKAYIALHNSYGVDLNETAVELAEVSIWLNVMHRGLQAPWFGLHLRRGNSLIGAGRRLYTPESLPTKEWLTTAPEDHPFSKGRDLPEGRIHHFLLPAKGWGSVAAEKEAKALAPEQAKRLGTWRREIQKAPSTKNAKGRKQIARLQAIARRTEYLWDLVIQRLEKSEAEIRREINVWGADWLEHPERPVPKEKIYEDLTSPGTPYWRLKLVMDAWCALWFWPVDKADMLDGTAEDYENQRRLAETTVVEVITPAPLQTSIQESLDIPAVFEQPTLDEAVEQLTISTAAAPKAKPAGKRADKGIRKVIPLASLEDWIDFAEATLGRLDMDEATLASEFESLADLERYESELPEWMGMDSIGQLGQRFPWLAVVRDIADAQGFFHWELQFAQVFNRGGFDLQVGNPPWVRPTWEEADVLAERDAWFKLANKPVVSEWRRRRTELLQYDNVRIFVLNELADQTAFADVLSSPVIFPLLAGTQPDLYRAFMLRAWANTGKFGTIGLLHPDTHLTGDREGALREAAYARLRVHGDFVNAGNRFFPPPVNRSSHFGLHIYGEPRDIKFKHLSWLFHSTVLTESIRGGRPKNVSSDPGIKYGSAWDERPHPARVIRVDEDTLADWRQLFGDLHLGVKQAKLLYPISESEQAAIQVIGKVRHRLATMSPRISSGYHEKGGKEAGLFRWEIGDPKSWSEVILKGPQIGVATPFFKQPPNTGTKGRPENLIDLSSEALPRSEYVRSSSIANYRAAQDRWIDNRLLGQFLASSDEVEEAGRAIALAQGTTTDVVGFDQIESYLVEKARQPYTQFYRLMWRQMIPGDTDRSLFPALYPPGPTHIHGVRSLALDCNEQTALLAGFWAALPVDYILRIAAITNLDVKNAHIMPAPELDHPLVLPLMLRTMRLNCLTNAYGDLWEELYEHEWRRETWAVRWPGLAALESVGPEWDVASPLRTERERRAALVEIDALVAVWLGLSAEQLVAIYRARFPQLFGYEQEMWFDADGYKIAGNWNSYGSKQGKEHWGQLVEYERARRDGKTAPVPEGFRAPFYQAQREKEYEEAHAVFSARLQAAREAGWSE